MIDSRVSALYREYRVQPVSKSTLPGPHQTRAHATVRKLLDRHGEGHLRDVFTALADTSNNKASLEAEVFGAVSDLLRACSKLYSADPSKFLEVMDRVPVGQLQAIAHDLRGFVPVRSALAGLIYERIWRAYGPLSVQPDLLDDRRVA